MELVKSSVRIARELGSFVSQVTLEQDVNVPDIKPDVDELVLDKGRIFLDTVRLLEERTELSGKLVFEVLYKTAQPRQAASPGMESLTGELSFHETMNTPGVTAQDYLMPGWDIEDLQIRALNSRKLTVSAVVTFRLEAGAIGEENLAEELEESSVGKLEVDAMKKKLELLELAVRKKEAVRIREEVELGSNKPNISNLLWKELDVGCLEYKLAEGKLTLSGDLLLFAIYQGEEEHIPLQWMEKSIPFTEEIDCPQCNFNQIADVQVTMTQGDVTVKPDYDGENRVLSLDTMLELNILLYEERTMSIVCDAYSPYQELVMKRKPLALPHLLAKNNAKCKLTEKLTLPEDAGCLQICYSQGSIRMDRVAVQEDLVIEGALDVRLLYMSSDDASPIKSWRQSVPFTHHLEVKGIHDGVNIHVRPQTEQMSTVMLGSTEVEVRAVLGFDTLVSDVNQEDIILDVTEQPFDEETLAAMPGMTGYIVGEGDTLWSIAKRFYTSIDRIKRYNNLTGDVIKTGEKLLIVKEGQL